MALLDNGVQINTIMPSFIKECSLNVGPLMGLVGRQKACVGLGNVLTWPLGYILIWVHIDGVQGYDKNQIALVIPDLSNFAVWVPVNLGTPMISCVINVIKEKEIDTCGMPWVNARVAYLLAVRQATAMIEDGNPEESDSNDYGETVTTKEAETTDAFSSQVIHAETKTAHRGEGINMMTQALCIEDRSLPQGLMVQNAYTELCGGSKNITVVVRNSTTYPQTLRKKTPVARAVAVTQIPELPVQIGLTEASEKGHGHQMPKLTVKQQQEKLFKDLELSGLEA